MIGKDLSDCTDVQAGLSLCRLHESYCKLCRALAYKYVKGTH